MTYPYSKTGTQDKKKLYFVMVLDNSTSMHSIASEARDAFNRQVESLAKTTEGLDCRVGLVTFDTKVNEPTVWNAPVESLHPLGPEDYRPAGWTALLDGLGSTIDRLRKMPDINDPHVNVLIVTISDGEENHSVEYKAHGKVAGMVTELEKSGRWTFVYEGANIDLKAVSATLGIRAGNSLAFQANSVGMARATMSRRDSTECYTKSLLNDAPIADFYANTGNSKVDIGNSNVDLGIVKTTATDGSDS